MTAKPSRKNVGGAAYLDLRKLANATNRPTGELHLLYALEGFLDRLQRSPHAASLVLKGGVLLAAYDVRRPTRDMDFAATSVGSDLQQLLALTKDILAIDPDDGLTFDIEATQIETTREGEIYPGARAKISGSLATANIRFHIDYNLGDPLFPEPEQTELPRLLGGSPPKLTGYRVELVLAEKIVTALQRGTANTRWRDFVDIAGLATRPFDAATLRESIRLVAEFRQTKLTPLSKTLEDYAPLAQPRWAAWRRKQQLHDTPEEFAQLVDEVTVFADSFIRSGLSE